MTVYADDARIPAAAGRAAGVWPHLHAGPRDDPAELHQLAAVIFRCLMEGQVPGCLA